MFDEIIFPGEKIDPDDYQDHHKMQESYAGKKIFAVGVAKYQEFNSSDLWKF